MYVLAIVASVWFLKSLVLAGMNCPWFPAPQFLANVGGPLVAVGLLLYLTPVLGSVLLFILGFTRRFRSRLVFTVPSLVISVWYLCMGALAEIFAAG